MNHDRLAGRSTTKLARLAVSLALTSPAAAQTYDETMQQAKDFHALVSADAATSAVCKSYIGRIVKPVAFDALVQSVKTPESKGEFETSAQYKARSASAPQAAGFAVLVLPTDRDYIHYDADSRAMTVEAGAFSTGRFSREPQAEVGAGMLALQFGSKAGSGAEIPYSQSERITKSYVGRNAFGLPVRVSEVDRHTRAIYTGADRLFASASDDGSPVLGFDATLAQAPQLKQTVKVALAVDRAKTYAVMGVLPGAAATSRTPIRYTERSTILAVSAKCGLAIDGQSRVLASIDTNPAMASPDGQ